MESYVLGIRWTSRLLWMALVLVGSCLPARTQAQAAGGPAYPLRVSGNGRYLVDRQGQPFLYVADTAWPLFSQLTKAETEQYLEDRRQKGFNTIQVSLLPWNIDSPNRAGEAAFFNDSLSRPNEAYFQHVDWVLALAAQKGMQLVVGPAWLGHQGQNYRPYLHLANARAYGQWVGERFARFDNLIWFLGGDDLPGDKIDVIRELAAGLRTSDRRHLVTYHGPAGRSSSEWFRGDAWLDFNMAQTYYEGAPSSYKLVLADYTQQPAKPTLNAEPNYENQHGTTAYHVRQATYWAALSGSLGIVYGADPIWNIGVSRDWARSLDLPGTRQIGIARQLLSTRAWHTLVPDQGHTVVTAGRGDFGGGDYVAAAISEDRRLLIAYLPSSRAVTVELGQLSAPSLTAHWFDPTTGQYAPAGDGTLANSGSRAFVPPATNASGERDFVLLIEAVAPPAEVALSELPWLAANNGSGPVERNMSVGGDAAGDGRPLTLNGRSFGQGLGVHASSDLRFALHGSYSRFSANIGVDDEVGSQGSVVFQVWADGELVFNSGVITGNSMNRQAHVSVAGKQELRLIVLDGGDGNAYDHANWADARLVR